MKIWFANDIFDEKKAFKNTLNIKNEKLANDLFYDNFNEKKKED